MVGCRLLPSSCVHHRRRDPQRRVTLHGRSYYLVAAEDVTELEEAKYQAICQEIGGTPDAMDSDAFDAGRSYRAGVLS